MRHPQYTLTRSHVHAHAARLLRTHLRLRDFSPSCPAATLVRLLFAACCWLTSLSDACRRLLGGPSRETARKALLATLPGYAELQRRLNRALQGDLPKALRRRRPR